jgi:tRNA A37 methylthiotransferase MiaB
MKKLNALMVGSVPLSLHELQLAPAIISAEVFNRGHDFQYYDINIELYRMCNRDKSVYDAAAEELQDIQLTAHSPVVEEWFASIIKKVANCDILIVNVFSILSQGAAYKIITRAKQHVSNLTILVGGIGSHRDIFGAVNSYNQPWLDQHLPIQTKPAFGQLMLDNKLADDWQSDVSTTVIDRWFPVRPSTRDAKVVNFDEHRIAEYEWKNNERIIPFITSYGCVRRCSFCDVIRSFPKYGYIEADALTQQIIETYKSTGISHLQFLDSLVNGSMSNFLSMLKNLANARKQGWLPEEIKWSGTYICRPRSPKLDQIHEHLGESGAENLIIGVETGSDKIRYTMDKKFTNDDLLYEIEQFNRVGVKCTLLFFPAWPTETAEDFEDTLKLFARLAPWAYRGTVDSIAFGTAGFVLHEGTPIYDNRQEIGLESGPANFLWKCKSNPTLNFWETMRRRMLMSRYSQMLGISLSLEAHFLRYLYYKIENDYQMIEDYHGPIDCDIIPDNERMWNQVSNNTISFRIINSNVDPVEVRFTYGTQVFEYTVPGGIYEYVEDVYTPIESIDITFEFKFDSNYKPVLEQYDSGDYYSANGVYIDYFGIDTRDATFNGFNSMFSEFVDCDLPSDYNNHCNERAIIANTVLTATKEYGRTLHEHVSRAIDPLTYQEIDFLTDKIKRRLENLYTKNVE